MSIKIGRKSGLFLAPAPQNRGGRLVKPGGLGYSNKDWGRVSRPKTRPARAKTGNGGSVMTITKDTIIGDILDMDRETAPYFLEIGMHCLGCPASRGETIEQACAVHGTDVNALVQKLNAHFAG